MLKAAIIRVLEYIRITTKYILLQMTVMFYIKKL